MESPRDQIIRALWEKQFEGSPWAGKFHLIRRDSLEADYGTFADQLMKIMGKQVAADNDAAFRASGRAPTPHEREILEILQEECAEVIAAVSKMLRFGIGNINPADGVSNQKAFGLEVGDLQHMLARAFKLGLYRDSDAIAGNHRKHRNLFQYLQTDSHLPAGGTPVYPYSHQEPHKES